MPSRPDVTASYAIPVRRARTLPAASFRFRLATDTLAVRLSVPTIRVRRGLAPPNHQSATIAGWMALTRHAPCLAHTKKKSNLTAALFTLTLNLGISISHTWLDTKQLPRRSASWLRPPASSWPGRHRHAFHGTG